MTSEPRTQEEIYNSLKSSLKGRIKKLTNFTERSFNYVWTQATSREIRKLEIRTTVSELAGFINVSGGPVTNDDLDELGIADSVTADEVNEFMRDEYLDQYVKIVGIDRLPGSRATGEVTFTTQSDKTVIQEGTVVTTVPDSTGDTIDFVTTEEAVSDDGLTSVSGVSIQAEEIGPESNVPSNTIVRLADPPLGVKGVDNTTSTTGGTAEESNDELRERAKQAVQSSSLGGTTDGIKGYLRQNIEAVGEGDIVLEEFVDEQPPFVDVIVDGGLDDDVIDAIEFSRPTGIRHNLVRPEVVELGFSIDLLGDNIDTTEVEDDISDFLLALGIGDNFYSDELIRIVMNSDNNIINIDNIGGVVERVANETFTFDSSQTDYRLDYTYEKSNGSITIRDASGDQFTEGSDFSVNDQTGDGFFETIVWSGVTPDDGETFFVDYDVTVLGQTPESDQYDTNLVRDEIFTWNEGETDQFTFDVNQDLYQLEFVPFDGTTSITDGSGDTFTEGTDYQMIDESGNGYEQTVDWSLSGATPDDGESFTVTYDQRVFHTVYEHRDTPGGIIRDSNGNVYNQDTEYITVDYDEDGENEEIDWQTNPSGINNGDEFYFTYFTEGDIRFADRQKADPGTITASSN